MKFKVAFYKDGSYLIKMILDNSDDEIWAKTTKAVYEYALKNFKEGEECEFEYTEKNDSYFINRILKKGSGTTTKKTETKPSSKAKCKDCGKELKDSKYEKCYTCNQKNPSKSTGGSGKPDFKNGAPYGSLLEVEATRRNKLATLSSACSAIQVMAGQISDADTLADMVLVVYNKLYTKLFG